MAITERAQISQENHKSARLIQEIGLQVRTKKQRKYNSYKDEQDKIVPNLLQQVEKLPKTRI